MNILPPWMNKYLDVTERIKKIDKRPTIVMFEYSQYSLPRMKATSFVCFCAFLLVLAKFSFSQPTEYLNDWNIRDIQCPHGSLAWITVWYAAPGTYGYPCVRAESPVAVTFPPWYHTYVSNVGNRCTIKAIPSSGPSPKWYNPGNSRLHEYSLGREEGDHLGCTVACGHSAYSCRDGYYHGSETKGFYAPLVSLNSGPQCDGKQFTSKYRTCSDPDWQRSVMFRSTVNEVNGIKGPAIQYGAPLSRAAVRSVFTRQENVPRRIYLTEW